MSVAPHLPKALPLVVSFVVIIHAIALECASSDKDATYWIKPLTHRGVNQIAFSHDGRTLATASRRAIRLWKIPSGEFLRELETDQVRGLVFNPRNNNLLSAGDDGNILIWDTEKGTCIDFVGNPWLRLGSGTLDDISTPRGYIRLERVPIDSFAVSADGQRVAAGLGKSVHVWDLRTKELVGEYGHLPETTILPLRKLTPDKNVMPHEWSVFLADYYHFNPIETKLPRSIDTYVLWNQKLGSDYVYQVEFSQDGRYIVAAQAHLTQAWNIETKEAHLRLEGCSFFGVSPDASLIAGASHFRHCRIWDFKTGQQVGKLSVRGTRVRFSEDGKKFLLSSGGHIREFDVTSGNEVRLFPKETHVGEPRAFAISPNGRYLSASWTRWKVAKIRLWTLD